MSHELKLRVDEVSWQGTSDLDMYFFLRRLREPNDHVFTDFNLGSMAENNAHDLVSEFIKRTGPFFESYIILKDLSPLSRTESTAYAELTKISDLLNNCLAAVNVGISGMRVNFLDGKYDGIIFIQPGKKSNKDRKIVRI